MKNLAFRVILASSLTLGVGGVAHAADRVDVVAKRVAAAALARQQANGGREVVSDSAPNAASFTLTLLNGWLGAPFGTNAPSVSVTDGIVSFRGGMSTTGTSTSPFVLPKGYRPKAIVYIPVDMCNATNGRLIIDTAGNVTVQAESDFSNAQCFTSLDGASFSQDSKGYKNLTLLNGWADTPYGTAQASARISGEVVQLQGSMGTSGTNPIAFQLPKALRPSSDVYVPVDLCGATNGRLYILKNGTAYVQAETDFSNAQCFTSLDGVSFTLVAGKLKLLNGWTAYGFGTAKPGVTNQNGVVRLAGAMSTTGTNTQPFKLPVTARPSAATYVKVDLCNAANGRLLINADGTVTVQAEGDFSAAQCFTSLEGVSFVQ